MSDHPMLKLDKVVFRYPGPLRTGVDLVSLEIKKGESVGVLGANGSGKSTLARLCCGLLTPQSGEVLIEGLSTRVQADLIRIRRKVGIVFQHPEEQFVANTVASEIAFGLEIQDLPVTELRTKVEETLELFDLGTLGNVSPHHLSGGEKARLTLASIWVLRPEVLLLDEPLAMLDCRSKRQFSSMLHNLEWSGTTFLWFGHHLSEVAGMNRVVVLDQGRIRWEGQPGELLSLPTEAKKWGITLPSAYELAEQLGPHPPGIISEEDLVSWLWKSD